MWGWRNLSSSVYTTWDRIMTRATAFKQSDVTRAVRAALAAGLCVSAVEVTPNGTIRVLTGAVEKPAALSDLERWEIDQGLVPRR